METDDEYRNEIELYKGIAAADRNGREIFLVR